MIINCQQKCNSTLQLWICHKTKYLELFFTNSEDGFRRKPTKVIIYQRKIEVSQLLTLMNLASFHWCANVLWFVITQKNISNIVFNTGCVFFFFFIFITFINSVMLRCNKLCWCYNFTSCSSNLLIMH